jgi:hypothetical protein
MRKAEKEPEPFQLLDELGGGACLSESDSDDEIPFGDRYAAAKLLCFPAACPSVPASTAHPSIPVHARPTRAPRSPALEHPALAKPRHLPKLCSSRALARATTTVAQLPEASLAADTHEVLQRLRALRRRVTLCTDPVEARASAAATAAALAACGHGNAAAALSDGRGRGRGRRSTHSQGSQEGAAGRELAPPIRASRALLCAESPAPLLVALPADTLAAAEATRALHQSTALILSVAGFDAGSEQALAVLADSAAGFIARIGRAAKEQMDLEEQQERRARPGQGQSFANASASGPHAPSSSSASLPWCAAAEAAAQEDTAMRARQQQAHVLAQRAQAAAQAAQTAKGAATVASQQAQQALQGGGLDGFPVPGAAAPTAAWAPEANVAAMERAAKAAKVADAHAAAAVTAAAAAAQAKAAVGVGSGQPATMAAALQQHEVAAATVASTQAAAAATAKRRQQCVLLRCLGERGCSVRSLTAHMLAQAKWAVDVHGLEKNMMKRGAAAANNAVAAGTGVGKGAKGARKEAALTTTQMQLLNGMELGLVLGQPQVDAAKPNSNSGVTKGGPGSRGPRAKGGVGKGGAVSGTNKRMKVEEPLAGPGFDEDLLAGDLLGADNDDDVVVWGFDDLFLMMTDG